MNKFDYLGNMFSSRILASNIEKFWQKRGHPEVKAWVETEEHGPSKIYVVRSNITLVEVS